MQIAKSTHPQDLILLDIMMPEMDGYEVGRQLKDDAITKDIPVIFLTVKSEDRGDQKGLEIGAADYIAKPISPPIVLTGHHIQRTQIYIQKLVRQLMRQFTPRAS